MDLIGRLQPLLRSWLAFYRGLPSGSRLAAVIATIVVIGGLSYFGLRQAVVEKVELMPGATITKGQLPLIEAAFAKAKLTGYEIQGTKIRVPRGQEAAFMAALADAKALPPDFGRALSEAVNSGNPFENSRQREERLKVARQAELALIIRSMEGIENAYVLYDIDERPGFNQEKLITATVGVKPVGGAQLDEARVNAIRHLMAGAIAGLKPENVTVSDLNGRTWYGKPKETESFDECFRLSLIRTYEQDLKAKILNALSFIPGVTVELSVTLDRQRGAAYQHDVFASGEGTPEKERVGRFGLAPASARVSVGVPSSYFQKIWRQRRPSFPDSPTQEPDPAELQEICKEETAKIVRHVAQLLPAPPHGEATTEAVTVTIFQDVTPDDAPHNLVEQWKRFIQHRITLGLYLSGIVCLLVLMAIVRGILRVRKTKRTRQQAINEDRTSHRGPPHWRLRRERASNRIGAEELSALVEKDPVAAANVLRKWLVQKG